MRDFPLTDELLALAPRIIWFEPPEKALSNPLRFMAYLLTYGTIEEISLVRKYISQDEMHDAIVNAPPGIMDERSWAYWNVMIGRYPPPPMPVRRLPA